MQQPLICDDCRQQFTAIVAPFCQCCGEPFDARAQSDLLCADCRQQAPPFAAARSAAIYHGSMRRAVQRLKYELIPALATPLGEYLAEHCELPFHADCLCPVPLHTHRQKMRGFNQSLLLAEKLSLHWSLPLQADILGRTVDIPAQMRLTRSQRAKNIRGAFKVKGTVAGMSIVLVDDVYTTGATLRECSRVLKKAGAAQVQAVTLARAMPEFSFGKPE